MRYKLFLLIAAVGLLIGPGTGQTQNPGSGNEQGRGGDNNGQDGGKVDHGQWFDQLSRGRPVWKRYKITNPRMERLFDKMASQLGVTDGEITRQQFIQAAPQVMAQWRGGRAQGGLSSVGSSGSPTSPTPTPGGPSTGTNPDKQNARVEGLFRWLDRNGDGVLSSDEMPETLRGEFDKWDTNKDGFIDLSEFKAYSQARLEQRRTDWAALHPGSPPSDNRPGAATASPQQPEGNKPVVYRAGKLPKELPAWFEELDTDHDGQVGLYEWKASGRPISEFLAMDRNNDGFLTVAEVLKASATANQAAPAGSLARGQR